MNLEVIITGIVGLITTITSSWVSWIFARKKYNSEVDHNIIENMKESLEFYEKLSNDNRDRLNSALEENKLLREDINSLLSENANLKKDIEDLRSQLLQLTTTICVDLSCQLRNRDYSTINTLKKNIKQKSSTNEKV